MIHAKQELKELEFCLGDEVYIDVEWCPTDETQENYDLRCFYGLEHWIVKDFNRCPECDEAEYLVDIECDDWDTVCEWFPEHMLFFLNEIDF